MSLFDGCDVRKMLIGWVQSSVVYLVLKYVVDWVDGQVAFLEAKDTAILFSFCVQLLEIYSAHNIGKVHLCLKELFPISY